MKLSAEQNRIHLRAIKLCREYLAYGPQIVAILESVDRENIFKLLGYRNLSTYAVGELGLDRETAYPFITIARKCAELALLKQAIADQSLSISKATRIVSTLSSVNEAQLIEFAKTHTIDEINQEVAKMNPRAKARDKVKPLSEEWFSLQCSISKDVFTMLQRARSVVSTRLGLAADFNQTLKDALDLYLWHCDPVEKAKRAEVRKEKNAAKPQNAAEPRSGTTEPSSKNHNDAKDCIPAVQSHESVQPLANQNIESHLGHLESASNGTEVQQSNSRNVEYQTPTPDLLCLNRVKSSNTTTQRRIIKRIPLTAEQKHAVYLRDQGRCTFIHPTKGHRCDCDRWTEIHHIIRCENGGTNELENLRTLCSTHHDLIHQLSLPLDGQYSYLRSPQAKYGLM